MNRYAECDMEIRYNPYHDPSTGRFTDGSGGSLGASLYVGRGQKGKGVYIYDRDMYGSDRDKEYEAWKSERNPYNSSKDKIIQDATNGVILKDEYTTIEAVATKRNKKAATEYSKVVLNADVDSNGNVTFNFAKGNYDGNYGDERQNVTYKIKAGAVDGNIINLDLSKANSISGRTYEVKEAAKSAGMKWNSIASAWVKEGHYINANTSYTASQLNSMSDKDVDNVFKSVFYKTNAYKGTSLGVIEQELQRIPSSYSREQKIEDITYSIFNKSR